MVRAPNGIRTRVTAVKGRCPRPLDDGDVSRLGNLTHVLAGIQTGLDWVYRRKPIGKSLPISPGKVGDAQEIPIYEKLLNHPQSPP